LLRIFSGVSPSCLPHGRLPYAGRNGRTSTSEGSGFRRTKSCQYSLERLRKSQVCLQLTDLCYCTTLCSSLYYHISFSLNSASICYFFRLDNLSKNLFALNVNSLALVFICFNLCTCSFLKAYFLLPWRHTVWCEIWWIQGSLLHVGHSTGCAGHCKYLTFIFTFYNHIVILFIMNYYIPTVVIVFMGNSR